MMGSSKAGPRAGDHIRAAETLRDAHRVLATGFRGLTTAAVAAA